MKDKHGRYLSIGEVVVNSKGDFYHIEGVDMSREYDIKLSNGCVKSYDKGENLVRVDNVSDFYEKW